MSVGPAQRLFVRLVSSVLVVAGGAAAASVVASAQTAAHRRRHEGAQASPARLFAPSSAPRLPDERESAAPGRAAALAATAGADVASLPARRERHRRERARMEPARPGRTARQRLLELASSILILASGVAAVAVFLTAGHHAARARVSAPAVVLTPAESSAAERFAGFREAVPVLATGALSRGSAEPGLEAETFARELTLLRAAGFTALGAREAERDLRASALPHRPFLLAVDGNAGSAWRIADPVLGRLGMKAVLLLDPEKLGRTTRYYLSGPELDALARSPRWEVGLHVRPDLGPSRIERTLAALGRRGIDATAALTFTHEPSPEEERRLSSVRDRFSLVLADGAARRYAVASDLPRAVPRLPLPGDAASLLPLLAWLAPRPADVPAPFDEPQVWRAEGSAPAPTRGRLVLAPPVRTWQATLYDRAGSAAWRDYRVRVTLAGLEAESSGTLLVRAVDERRLSVTVSSGRVSVRALTGDGSGDRILATAPLHPATRHAVGVTVAGDTLAVRVDGESLRVRIPPGFQSGGIGVGAWRLAPRRALVFTDLVVRRLREDDRVVHPLSRPGLAPRDWS